MTPRRGSRPDWEIFQAVAQAMGARWSYRTAEDVFREIARLVPIWSDASWGALLVGGHAWSAERPLVEPSLTPADPPSTSEERREGLWLLSGGVLFLQGSLAHRGELLPRLAGAPRAWLHPDEARSLDLGEGEALEIEGPGGRLLLPVALDGGVPRGSVFVPYAQAGVSLNRLGAPSGGGLRVMARRAASMAAV